MTSDSELVIGEIKRFVRFPFLLIFRVMRFSSKEVAVGFSQIIKSPFHHTLGDMIRPGVAFLSNGIELFFERKRVGWGEHTLLFWSRFLFQSIRLILLFPLCTSPVVHKSTGTTGTFQIFHLLRSGIHSDSMRGFHLQVPSLMHDGTS